MTKIKKKVFDKKLLFYCCLIALPLLQYAIFYVYVNFNSFVLAFSKLDTVGNSAPAGFNNFADVWNVIFGNYDKINNSVLKNKLLDATQKSNYVILGSFFGNSVIDYLLRSVVGMGGSLFFSYYIYKKKFCGGFFKVILFLPHIIPSIALVFIYSMAVNNGLSTILRKNFGVNLEFTLLDRSSPMAFGMVVFYSLFISFGTQTMMYLGAMNKINPSITEAGQLDGVSFIREFVSITVPCIFSTIATFIVVGLTGIFATDMGLYSFFGGDAPMSVKTIGYYMIKLTRDNTSVSEGTIWPYMSAMGLCFTIIVAPITIALKRLLDRVDPTK